jgi:hypothetical protein
MFNCVNRIENAEGGRQVSLFLQRCPNVKMLDMENNSLGPLGASTLAPALSASASHLKGLELSRCGIGNAGVANLVASGETKKHLIDRVGASWEKYPRCLGWRGACWVCASLYKCPKTCSVQQPSAPQ